MVSFNVHFKYGYKNTRFVWNKSFIHSETPYCHSIIDLIIGRMSLNVKSYRQTIYKHFMIINSIHIAYTYFANATRVCFCYYKHQHSVTTQHSIHKYITLKTQRQSGKPRNETLKFYVENTKNYLSTCLSNVVREPATMSYRRERRF